MFADIYRKISEKEIPECGGQGTVYEHRKTGAKIFTLRTEDINKVFMIGFRTTPEDSTGVAHIMEHSVLCGSEKFPLKDPFVELVKGSLNTFLNAMTYPDKTVYPVASCNDKDFMNLMDVYLDAVFHPNIYKEKKIFLQEGWHYEFSEEDDELTLNGVVYNEMKGAFSNPDSVLERFTLNALYRGTTYEHESGGDPEEIPNLTYEQFLEFHRTYYHPSNSYIYLYGDMDMEEKLLWMDEHYLNAYGKRSMDTAIGEALPVPEGTLVEKSYALSEGEDLLNRTYLSENYVLPKVEDSLTDLAWEVLDFVLLGAPGAPLSEILMEKGIGEEICGGYCAGIKRPYWSVIAKNSEKEKLGDFHETVKECITGLCENGIDKNSLLAALNFIEFKYREEDFGRTPAGLSFGLNAMESWLYDLDPTLYLTYNEEFKKLKELAATSYFEDLLREAILRNTEMATVIITPEKGLTEKKEEELREKLSAYKASLSEEQVRKIRETEKALKAYQDEPDDPRLRKCLPTLGIADIRREADKVRTGYRDGIIYSDIPTHGIAYMRLIYDLSSFTEEEIQFVSLLKSLFGDMETGSHSVRELSDEMFLKTGGISHMTNAYSVENGKDYKPAFIVELRTLKDHIEDGIRLAMEMTLDTRFDNEERVIEKLLETKSSMQARLDGASHSVAVTRCRSYQEGSQRFEDLTGGIAFNDFLSGAAKMVKEPVHKKRFLKSLKNAAAKLGALPFEAVLSGDEECFREMKRVLLSRPEMSSVKEGYPEAAASLSGEKKITPVSRLNEGLKCSSQVNYVARTGRFTKEGEAGSGAYDVLRILLNYDYLWTNLRVKGGAYGCMSGFMRSGQGYLVSYRDPKLKETDDVYAALPEYLENLELSGEDLTKYIIGAIASVDQPVTASVEAARGPAYYYNGTTDEILQKSRDEIIGCTAETIRSMADGIRRLLSGDSICVIGNAGAIEKESGLFRSVRELY